MQICRVEDINVEGTVKGSILQFHWVRSVVIPPSGKISASGFGMHFVFILFTYLATLNLRVKHKQAKKHANFSETYHFVIFIVLCLVVMSFVAWSTLKYFGGN